METKEEKFVTEEATGEFCKNGHPKIFDNQLKIKGCKENECEYSVEAILKLIYEKKGFSATKEIPQQIVINSTPPKIGISTNAKGQHQWEIAMQGDDLFTVFKEIMAIDDLLMEKYKAERGSQ